MPGADDLDATWLLDHAAAGLDLSTRHVLRGPLAPVDFDGLVIATGARARELPGASTSPAWPCSEASTTPRRCVPGSPADPAS